MISMSLMEKTKFLLRRYRIFPEKHLGQNFIVEPSIFQFITGYGSLSQNDVVIDIGAGLGFLTRFLAGKCKHVLSVESDSRLVRILREQLKDLPNITIVEGDILKVRLSPFDKVVSAPPYYISSPLLLWLFNKNFECAVLIFQKEFANRLVAPIGSKDYGWLTVTTYYHAEVELLNEVARTMFYPQPEVNSIVVRLTPRKPPPFILKNRALFEQLVQALFTQRNRKVRNGVLPFIKRMDVTTTENAAKLVDLLPFHDKRIRELTPENFGALANALAK